MSATIVHDTIDTNEVIAEQTGYKATRRLILSGVTASTIDGIVYAGVTDSGLAALGVGLGIVHPTMTALYCSQIRGKAIDTDKVELIVSYSPFKAEFLPNNTQQPKLTISSFIQSQETNEDKNGDPLVVTHTGDPDIVATVSIDTCLTNLQFERMETAAPIGIQSYVDTLNSAGVTWRGVTFAAKTLKITSINGTPKDDSGNYLVTYNILYNPNGWQATVVYTKDGVVPGDVSGGNGIATYDMYPTSTFSSLNLS